LEIDLAATPLKMIARINVAECQRTTGALERATEECGGFMNWIWLDEHHSKYKCK